jgi:HPt (histidine-containing phosphotransfer) domain-containing protein
MSLTKEDLIDFNIIQGLKDLGGDDGDEFLKEIIDLYKEQYPILLRQIKNFLDNKDYENLSKSAHALKGASLNIGAKELASVCKNIEINAKTDITEGYSELITNLESIHSLTFDEIDKL